jgi:hypothetical protein
MRREQVEGNVRHDGDTGKAADGHGTRMPDGSKQCGTDAGGQDREAN